MQTTSSVSFRDMPGSPDLEAQILAKVKKLERYCDRIASCRVTLSAPHRHLQGGVFHLRIDLAVPGEKIVIHHEAGLDHAHEDIRVAIREAFRSARRRLQDHVRRTREFTVSSTRLEPALGPSATVVPKKYGTREVEIQAGSVRLSATLTIPAGVQALVICAQASGSVGRSEAGGDVLGVLHSEHLGTLRLDLLTADEQRKRQNVFDISLLARRLTEATRWVQTRVELPHVPIGYFSASTGAAAALVAAAGDPAIGAVVCRGGRPGLAISALPFVFAPTLLIVGGEDGEVLTENRNAFERLGGPKDIVVIPGASRLFRDLGALEEVARKARAWFVRHLTPTEVVQ